MLLLLAINHFYVLQFHSNPNGYWLQTGNESNCQGWQPVVPLTDFSSTVAPLILLREPSRVATPPITSEADLDGVATFMKWLIYKYQMFKAQQLIETMLMEQPLVDAYPHLLFIHHRRRLECPPPRIQDCSCYLERARFPLISTLYHIHMRRISADRLQSIYNFHHACGTAAQELMKNFASVPYEALGYGDWHTT
jgi:hypothetical protein